MNEWNYMEKVGAGLKLKIWYYVWNGPFIQIVAGTGMTLMVCLGGNIICSLFFFSIDNSWFDIAVLLNI